MITNFDEIEKSLEEKNLPLRIKFDNGYEFALEKKLLKKLITMSKRITKYEKDCFLINEGYEGDGKTTSSLIEAVIIQSLIAKEMDEPEIHMFFKTSSVIDFAKKTYGKIIILDEPAIESLSSDSISKLNKDFLRIVTTIRKRHHFFLINFTKFWKFPDFITLDRALGMVRMDTKNGKNPRRFLYIRKKNLESLWNDKKKRNRLSYSRLNSFGGRMPKVPLDEIFSKFKISVEKIKKASLEDYEKEKDKAIESIGEEKISKSELRWRTKLSDLKYKLSQTPKKLGIPQVALASALEISPSRLREWSLKVN